MRNLKLFLFAILGCGLTLGFVLPGCGGGSILVGPYVQDSTPTSMWVLYELDSTPTSGEYNLYTIMYGLTSSLGSSTQMQSAQVTTSGNSVIETQLTGLSSGTTYYYRVNANGATSGIFTFRTPASGAEGSFKFIAMSDMQIYSPAPDSYFQDIINNGVLSLGSPIEDEIAFMTLSGDVVSSGYAYSQWKNDLFDEMQNFVQHVPVYAAIGNHEYNSDYFNDYFHPPSATAWSTAPGHTYYFDKSNVRFISLDVVNYQTSQQLTWLDGILSSAETNSDIDFVIAFFHYPYKTETWLSGEHAWVGNIVFRLEDFTATTGKPSFHLFGHSHSYERGQSKDVSHVWMEVASGEGDLAWWGAYAQQNYDVFQKALMEWGFVLFEVTAGSTPSITVKRMKMGEGNDPYASHLSGPPVISDQFTISYGNTVPNTPTALTPNPDNPPANPSNTVLDSSAFSDSDGTGHLESQFQVSTTSGDYSNPVADKWIRFEDWYNGADQNAGLDITQVTVGLQSDNNYYWRVRYRDQGLEWSAWSAEENFTTSIIP